MLLQDISTSQILTAGIFIAILLGVQIYIIKNKNSLKGKWGPNQRIILTDTTRLSPTEKVQIIKVDNTDYLYFFSKGTQPVIIPMPARNKVPVEPRIKTNTRLEHQHSGSKSKSESEKIKSNSNNVSKSDRKIIQAISVARKQNPKVSFEWYKNLNQE